jgi:four helix bundle protein
VSQFLQTADRRPGIAARVAWHASRKAVRMAGVRDHRELDVWILANEARARVAQITARPGFREHLWLRTQLRKAANSACANAGEGFSRYKPKDHARFLNIAKASLTEICEHLEDARHLKLASAAEIDQICIYARRARGAATGLIRYLNTASPPV